MLTHRDDLQFLRSLDVVAVMAYHLAPDTCPQGYFGIDAFFVISGFLMTAVVSDLAHTPSSILKRVTSFYSHQLKGLLPAYFFAIWLTLLASLWLLSAGDFVRLQHDALWAVGFGTGLRSVLTNETYIEAMQEPRILAHLWCLDVVMQICLLAPLLLGVIDACPMPLALTILFGAGSFAFQLFFSPSKAAFVFGGCRLWQFLVGTLAFYVNRQGLIAPSVVVVYSPTSQDVAVAGEESGALMHAEPPAVTSFPLLYAFVVACQTAAFFGPQLSGDLTYEVVIRTIVTLSTAVLIAIGTSWHPAVPFIVTSTVNYMGDLSYVLYLVHWPVVAIWRLKELDAKHGTVLMVALVVMLAIAVHHQVERHLEEQSCVVAVVVTACMIGWTLAFSLITVDSFSPPPSLNNSSTTLPGNA